ncbi:hypothetical protein ACFLW4_00105 [Chloroflexota bacterium]
MNTWLFISVMVALFILAVFVIPQLMLMRNIPKVIRMFRERNAIGEKNARTMEELGLLTKPLYKRMFSRRDYKAQAMQFMIRTSLIEITEDGKLYINEDNLYRTKWRTL